MGLPITGWFEGPDLPGGTVGAGVVKLTTGEILVCGGATTVNDITNQAYLIAADGRSVIGTIAPMSVPRVYHQIIEIYPYVFVIGGQTTESAEVYNEVTHTWSAAAAIGYGGSALVDAMLVNRGGGKVRVIGGFDLGTNCYTHVRDYDTAANTWSTVPSLPAGRAGGAAFFDSFGFTVVAGGYQLGGTGYNDSLIFDGSSWSNLGAFADGAAKVWPLSGSFPFPNTKKVLAGGLPSTVPPQTTPAKAAYVWTPAGGSGGAWTRIGDMISGRFSTIGGSMVTSQGLAVLSTGHMVAFSNGSQYEAVPPGDAPYEQCEILDPVALTWSALPETSVPVDEVVAMATSNDDVIVIGGDYAGGSVYPSSRTQTSDITFAPPPPPPPPVPVPAPPPDVVSFASTTADLGQDFSFLSQLDPRFSLVGGLANLGQAQVHRLETARGSLFYDLNYGTDIRSRVNSKIGPADLASIANDVRTECLKDERVLTCSCGVDFNAATSTLTLTITEDTSGGPFRLILAVTSVSVTVLNADQPS